MHFLYQTIKDILNAGEVGVPVFVRCLVQVIPNNNSLIDLLGKLLMMAGSWMDTIPIKVYVQQRNIQVNASVLYTGGQTAIVSVNTAMGVSPKLDLMMIGNKGALYHDGTEMPPGFDFSFDHLIVPDWLMDAMERSIDNGRPEVIEEVRNFD